MTEETAEPVDPASLLTELRQLRRSARSARHAYWFPLVLFGGLTLAAIPFYLTPASEFGVSLVSAAPGPKLPILGGDPPLLVQDYLGYYWLAALLGGLALTLWWYRRHARRIGLRTPARGYLITVSALTIVALVLPFLSRLSPFHFLYVVMPGDLIIRGTFPFVIIAIGLCVLAWAERSRALGVIAVVYTGTALLASLYDVENLLYRVGWNLPPGSAGLPNVLLPAIVLLAAGAGAFGVQRRQRAVA